MVKSQDFFRRLIACLPLAALLATGAAGARELSPDDLARPIIVASDPWCPYACDPDADGREGYMVEMAREIFEALGFQIEYRIVNFGTMKRMAQDGSATALPGVATTVDGAVILPAVAQGNSANAVALGRSRSFAFRGPADFEPFRLGVIKDYDYGGVLQTYIDQNLKNPDRIAVLSGFGYSHLVQGLRMITAGRVDMLLDDDNVLRWQIRRLGLEQQVHTVRLDDDADLFVGFSANDPRAAELARIMADGTRRLRESGRLAEILRSYGLNDGAGVLN